MRRDRISIANLLSFGPDGRTLPLRHLNVLVGPSGSGKPNLIEATCPSCAGLLALLRDLSDLGPALT